MKLKYGVVGFGPRCKALVMCIRQKGNLIVGFDPAEKSQNQLIKFNAKIAENFEDLLNTDGLEAVIIGSPPQFHATQAIAALESGLHVFSEVPMAINKEDTEKILGAAESNPKARYILGENGAYHKDVLYASHLIESNKIGPAVYCETEYLHDVSYRWRGKNVSDYKNTPVHQNWYSLFDPLMYAHAILPAQVAMGGLQNPMPLVEVKSYANSIGGDDSRDKPVCSPAECFHVGLFKGKTGAIAKCASGYVFAREPSRYICQLTGRYGTYESFGKGERGKLFWIEKEDGFNINKWGHRVSKSKKITKKDLNKYVNQYYPLEENQRIIDEWLNAIKEERQPTIHAKIAANTTMAGIAASESAKTGKTVSIPTFE